jgi:hypothetical protein
VPVAPSGDFWSNAGRQDRQRSDEARDQPELRVRLDELLLGADDARHEGALRDRVRLLHHERAEREREQQERVERERHQQRQHHPDEHDDLDHEPAAAPHPVDGRPDERRHEQERDEADAEEQQHSPRGGVRIDAEQHRVGERDRHRRVAGGHRGVGACQPA